MILENSNHGEWNIKPKSIGIAEKAELVNLGMTAPTAAAAIWKVTEKLCTLAGRFCWI